MKKVLCALLITSCIMACKKNNSAAPEHEESIYRVFLIGNARDTTQLPDMSARMETTGLAIAQDDKLVAELLAYQNINGMAYYTVRVTNLQPCQMIIRWDWEEIGVTTIIPNDTTGGPAQYDVLKASQTKIYTITGLPKPGKIKLQGQHINSSCPNSSTLIINITNTILPVRVVQHRADYDKQTNKTTISFTVEDPLFFDWILINRYKGNNEWEQAALIGADHQTKNYSIKL